MKMLQRWGYPVLFLFIISNSVHAESLLIANMSVAQTSISEDDVDLVFLGKKQRWNNGARIYVGVLKHGPVHEAFLDEFVNRTPSRFASYWKKILISGTGHPPKMFDTEEALVNYVAEKKGAIGYISPYTSHDNVKVLTVE